MNKPPAFQFYVSDFLTGTAHFRPEEVGSYIRLLCFQWEHGGIDEQDMDIVGGLAQEKLSRVKKKFEKGEDGLLRNKRLEETRERQRLFSIKQGLNGKKGGRPKKAEGERIDKDADWHEMVEFFGNKCLCCGYVFPEGNKPTKDHIIARANGGIDHISNYQPLCRQCNTSKFADHSTDYRLNFLDEIPQDLKEKWFQSLTKTEPKNTQIETKKSPSSSSSSSSSNTSLTSTSSSNKEKQATKKSSRWFVPLRDKFLSIVEKKGMDYYFTAKDGAALKAIESKIIFLYKSKNEDREPTEKQVVDAWEHLLTTTKMKFVLENFTVPIINSKWNEIINDLKELKNGKQQHVSKQNQDKLNRIVSGEL